MSDNNIVLVEKHRVVAGRQLYNTINENADTFRWLINNNYLTEDDLRLIEKLGFDVKIKPKGE